MNPVTLPADICGVRTLESAQGAEKEELDRLLKRAERILPEARLYQIPYIADTSKPKRKQILEKKRHQENVDSINQQIDDVILYLFQNNRCEVYKMGG
ncbi:unnamed protein product [Gongylonema pulchrum]|uniref:Enkurin domain-containing protein n=1 Tax=Gongylonema pulchrum TaxID=637853 RepID=A0A183ER61_9BILA|nr:unnamed protein product [Gongylonema pulchrum]